MPALNVTRPLVFSNDWITSSMVVNAADFAVGDSIVVNLATTPAVFRAGDFRGSILPFQSRQLKHCRIEQADRVAVFTVRTRENLGGLALLWDWFGNPFPDFGRYVPLYVSPQDEITQVSFLPSAKFVFDGAPLVSKETAYNLKLNLWYAPAQTDCSIHFEHSFLEVHTQLIGTGHMQKFQSTNAATMFEDVLVPPGATHEPFFQYTSESTFQYPMHRYFSEDDCVWMAIELHPVAEVEGAEQ